MKLPWIPDWARLKLQIIPTQVSWQQPELFFVSWRANHSSMVCRVNYIIRIYHKYYWYHTIVLNNSNNKQIWKLYSLATKHNTKLIFYFFLLSWFWTNTLESDAENRKIHCSHTLSFLDYKSLLQKLLVFFLIVL